MARVARRLVLPASEKPKSMNTPTSFVAAIFAACTLAGSPLIAQKANFTPAGKATGAYVLMPGVLTGPGGIGPVGRRRFCDARSVGLTQLQTDWVAHLLKLNEAQMKALDDLAALSGKAINSFATACPKRVPRPQTSPEQFEMMENRIDNAVQAVKSVRPVYAAFYSLLDDKQKAKLDEIGPKRSGWLW